MSGRQLGNFPQAFTHVCLITTAAHLSAISLEGPEADGDRAHPACDVARVRRTGHTRLADSSRWRSGKPRDRRRPAGRSRRWAS